MRPLVQPRFLTTRELVTLYPFLKAPTIAKWIEGGHVATNHRGARSEQDCINRFVQNNITGTNVEEKTKSEKLRKLSLEANLLEIEEQQQLGKLIWLDDAIDQITTAFSRAKTKFLGLGARMSVELSGLSEPHQIKSVLDKVTREVCEELSTELAGEKKGSE